MAADRRDSGNMYAGTETLCIRYDILLDVLSKYTREQVSKAKPCDAGRSSTDRPCCHCTKLPIRC
jgi:hypothetical protein